MVTKCKVQYTYFYMEGLTWLVIKCKVEQICFQMEGVAWS